jgi:hypothetical protein
MSIKSDVIVQGYIGNKRVEFDRMGRLITLTEVEVIDGIHGAKTGEVITIYQVGGEKNGLVMPIIGGHRYEFGNEVLFFGVDLDKKNDRKFVSVGVGHGKFDIQNKERERSVLEDLGNIGVIEKISNNPTRVVAPLPLNFSSLKVLKQEIELIMEKNKR